jgi:hypothetical protein
MFSPTSPFLGGTAFGSGGSSGFSGRDIVWVDLRFPPGVGVGTEELPFNTANIGIGALPSGGTLVMVGGDAGAEPGVTIGAGSGAFVGWGGQKASGGLTPVLPTLTYAITTGTQRLAFRNISVALVHSGTNANLSEFYFEFCPTVTLTAGGDASPVYWVGAPGNIFSGSGGAAQFVGGTIAGYVANGGGAVSACGSLITGDITSSSTITLTGGCTFGGALSITAPTINVDITTLYNATIAGVTFSSTVHLLVPMGTPSDIGTANSTGTATTLLPSDHVHRITFTPLNAALATANAAININGQKITGSAAPTAGTDLVTKTYADAIAVGLKVKTPAVAVATANQATLSGTAQTIDGVALNTIGQRVLLTAQTTATQNGLWVVAAGAWTRPADFATGSGAAQSYVLVTGGTLNAGSSYFCTNVTGSDVVDTANLTWVLFSQSATVTAGAGLTKTGNTLDVIAGDATIVVHADDIVVGVIGNANLADNTIALARLVNAGGQNHFAMRVSGGSGAWEDGTLAQAQAALGITSSGALKSVRAATTANITLSGTQTVDGVALIANDRCLVKNQTTGSQNGIYVVAAGAWARSSDAASAGQLFGGILVPVSEGTANGNRVAILTTDDPITIATTALTFAMDRIVPVASVAPQDVTNGAAQIGTAVDGARADHVHSLTFTVVAAVLAAASTAIAVNSQKITGLATPTVATDAATKGYVDSVVLGFAAPANPGDNGKIAYANAGALAYATNIKTDGTRYQFGTTGTGGLLNFAHGSVIASAANNAGTQVVPVARWGVFLNDLLYFGSASSDAGKVANMRWGVDTSGAYQWEVNSTQVAKLNSQGLAATPVATTGAVAPALWIIDAAHTALTLSTERHSVLFDLGQTRQWATGALATERAMRVVAPTIAFVGSSTVTTAATVAISDAPAAGANATITNALALWLESGAAGFGSTPARSGVGRFSGNTALKWRNLGGTPNTFDVQGFVVDASDNVVVGDNTNGTALYLDCKTGGTANVRVGSSVYTFSGATLNMNAQVITFGTAFVSGTGLARTTPSPNQIISSRNYDNTGDQDVVHVSSDWNGSTGTFTDIRLGDGSTKGHNSLYARAKAQVVVELATVTEYAFFATYADWKDNQVRFGSNPSVIGLLNFSNNVTVASGRDSGGTDRNLLGWTSANHLTVGSGNISVDLFAQGNTWAFGSTAAFPGVLHAFAAGATLAFGTASTNATVNFPSTSAVLLGAKNISSTDRSLVSWSGTDVVTFGSSALTTVVAASGGSWIFSSIASFPGVELNLASGGFVAFTGSHATNGDIRGGSTLILSATGTISLRPTGAAADAYAFDTTNADFKTHNLKVDNAASVPSAPASGGYLYAEGGALKWVSSTGRVTTMGFA